MYHFVADHPPVPVRLSFRASVPGHVRQYLKQFQIDAIQFMHNFLAKGEFCCYNDESGLGKQAAVAVLLDVACSNKKTLIVVQNDDSYVHGWEFHFSVLTNASVLVIKENKVSTNSPHNVYIAKWSTLRAIDDMSKFDFDFIILDNRGQMLNNNFCTSTILKHYERKINILISSVDITSDLKLLHNVLKLGGRLDPRYTSFKVFEDKFKLPDAKELAYKKVDLEDYFLRRERLADYCKHYRLRRYCHQFEQHLPLVQQDRYKINLEIWREKQSATNSEGSSVEVTEQNRLNEKTRNTQELFEEYCRQRRIIQEREKLKQEQLLKQQREQEELKKQEERRIQAEKDQQTDLEIVYNVDDEVALINATPSDVISQPLVSRDNTEEGLLMSPLLVVSDSEDLDDVPEICNDPNDDQEVVDLSSEDEGETNEIELETEITNEMCEKNTEAEDYNLNQNLPKPHDLEIQTEEDNNSMVEKKPPEKIVKQKRSKHLNEADKLRADVATNLKFQNETTPKRRTRHEEELQRSSNLRKRANPNETKSPTATSNARRNITIKQESKASDSLKNNEKQINKKDNQTQQPQDKRVQRKSNITEQDKQKENPCKDKSRTENTSPLRSTRSNNNKQNITNDIVIKLEPDDEPSAPQPKKSDIVMMRLERIKRELDIDYIPLHCKETRSMQRSTRAHPASSKYAYTNLSLYQDRQMTPKTKKKQQEKPKINSNQKKENQTPKINKDVNEIKNTQAPIISMTCSQDYEPLQCAQRLSDVVVNDTENSMQKNTTEFLIPSTPLSAMRNSLIPSSFTSSNGFFPDSEVIFVPPSAVPKSTCKNQNSHEKKQKEDVIILSGSETENSLSTNTTSTSRRTKALKPRRMQNINEQPPSSSTKVSSFSQLLAQHQTDKRNSTKSPDLFSNCSDLGGGPLTLTQPVNNKEKDNEEEEPTAPFEGFKIFGSEVKQMQQHYALTKTQNPPNAGKNSFRDRSCLDILENMFEPKNKKPKTNETTNQIQKGPKTNSPIKKSSHKTRTQIPIVPNHPIEAIAEAKAQKELMKQKRSNPLNEDEIFEITNNGTFGSVMRLHSNGEISPVQQKASKSANKITKYFMGNGLTQAAGSSLNGSQEDSGNNSESGTPNKKQHQQQPIVSSTQGINAKKSPRQKCSLTQATKLTKWFTKNSPSKQNQEQTTNDTAINNKQMTEKPKRQVRRRRLDLTQVTDDSDCFVE